MRDLWAALCLVAVLEGLLLFLVPGPWKRAMESLQAMPEPQLRRIGAVVLVLGLVSLWLVRTPA